MKSFKRTLLATALALLALPVMADPAHPKIGFSIDDLRLERWSRDVTTLSPLPKNSTPKSSCNRPMPMSKNRSPRSKT